MQLEQGNCTWTVQTPACVTHSGNKLGIETFFVTFKMALKWERVT